MYNASDIVTVFLLLVLPVSVTILLTVYIECFTATGTLPSRDSLAS